VLRKGEAQLTRGSVPVVGRRIDDNGEAVRPVAFVAQFLDLFFARAARSRDRPFDVIARHVVLARFLDRKLQPVVRLGIGRTGLRRQRDLAREAREERAALLIGLCLPELNILPFSAHNNS